MESPDKAIDVRRWLAGPDDYSQSSGIVGSFYGAVFDLFSQLINKFRISNASPETIMRYTHELRRLYLWGDGFSLDDGHLDATLAKSSELRHNVLSLMLQLSRVLSSEFYRAMALSHKDGNQDPSGMAELRQMQEQVGIILCESGAQAVPPMDSDSASDSQISDIEEEALEDITTYIDCLMDIGQALEHPAIDLFHDLDEGPQEVEVFEVTSPQALTYCRKIRDRFLHLPKYLVERLGEQNAERARRISLAESVKGQRPDIPDISEVEQYIDKTAPTEPPTESLFSSRNLRLTETTQSTMETSSFGCSSGLPSTLVAGAAFRDKKPNAKPIDLDDAESIATYASYSTTASAVNQGRPRMPPLPENAHTSGTFDCPACWREMRGPMSRVQWKQHIFNDLLPYCCIYEACEGRQFSKTKPWVAHVQSHADSAVWPVSVCLFCGPNSRGLDREAFFKHLSGHFREVALAALHQAAHGDEDDSDEGSDDSSLQSNLASSQVEETHGSDNAIGSANAKSRNDATNHLTVEVQSVNVMKLPQEGPNLVLKKEIFETKPDSDLTDLRKIEASWYDFADRLKQSPHTSSKMAVEQDSGATTAIDIPLSPRIYHRMRRSSDPPLGPGKGWSSIANDESGTTMMPYVEGTLPCELHLYNRCNLDSLGKDAWKEHVLSHFEGRIPWQGPWDCWFCDKNFDNIVLDPDSEDDLIREPAYLNIQAFYERLDHIEDHIDSGLYSIEEARRNASLRTWLGPDPRIGTHLIPCVLCRECGATYGVELGRKTCMVCRSFLAMVGQQMERYTIESLEGARCSTQPFGGPDCDHEWHSAGTINFCDICQVVVEPGDWEHTWLEGKDECCYCGIRRGTEPAKNTTHNDERGFLPSVGHGVRERALSL